jgi:hypothetical protein
MHLVLARLAQEGDLRAVQPLIDQWGHQDADVRQSASRALESIRKAVKHRRQLLCGSCLARFEERDYRLPRIDTRPRRGRRRRSRRARTVSVRVSDLCETLADAVTDMRLKGVDTVSIPVCRICGRSDKAKTDIREVVAVLDTEMSEELACADGVARVGYLKRDAPFDFDRVEIARAGDYEVERFCVQVGNDADSFRRGRYSKMRCVVASECRLSENTLRILRSMFGEVGSRA